MRKLLLILFLSVCAGSVYSQTLQGRSIRLYGTVNPGALSSDQNNYVLQQNASQYNLSATTPITISGFSVGGQRDGLEIYVCNTSAFAITLPHESDLSVAANRFNFSPGTDLVLGANSGLVKMKYDETINRWRVVSNGSLSAVSSISSPLAQATNLSTSTITSSSVTINWSHSGDADFAIVLMSETPISEFPAENTEYTSDLNYGDGQAIGDAFVMGNVSGTDPPTLDITGLTAGTTYYTVVFSFNTQGGAYRYNTTIGSNSSFFTTLSDATTPTVQWVTTSKKSFETSIQITGTRGNGDGILVVTNDSIPVSVDPVDGVSYPVGAFGAGEALTERNFVTNDETGDFSITGLLKDRKYWFKIMEYESTGDLYNTQATIDSGYVAYVYDSTFIEGAGTPPGQTYAEGQSFSYYDFSDLTFADEANITNGDAGLADQSPLSNTATIQGTTPTTNEVTFGGALRKGARTGSGTAIDTNHDGDAWAASASGFEVHAAISLSDGIAGTSGQYVSIGGVLSGSLFHIRISHLGALQINYKSNTGTTTVWQSSSPITTDGLWSAVVQVRLDFSSDIFSAYVNGSPVTGSVISGDAISAVNPTTFNSSHDFVIGNFSSSGSLVSNTNGATITTVRFKTTALLTAQERQDIYEWFSFTSTGSLFNDYDVTEGSGFDYETENDTLKLSNGSAGFGDYLKHVDVLPDSLQELEVSSTFKIASASTTNASSYIIGLRNATTTEANYGVWGHLNLDTDGSFGRIQIFSGNGSIGDVNWEFRASTGGPTPVALDSVFTMALERTINGNDAFYSLRLLDRFGELLLNVGWLELNRPSSQYYGTTMRAFIGYQGDTDIHVAEFSVVRIGEAQVDTSPPPTPTVGNAYVVASGGDDADDCTEEEPCATIPRGLERIGELGGSDRVLILSSGIHILNTAAVLPTNLGRMEGAGVTATRIEGTANFNRTFWYPPAAQTGALIQAISGSAITTTNHLKGFTISGGSYLNRLKPIGIYVKNRDQFVLENVNIEYFNSSGLVIDGSDDMEVTNCNFLDAGGSGGNQNPATGYPTSSTATGGYATGNITLTGLVDGLEWVGGSVTATNYGGGYGFKGQLQTPFVPTHNIHIDGVRFYLHPRTSGSTGTNFAIEFHDGYGDATTSLLGDLEIENCYFNNCAISFGVHQNAVDSYTHRIHHNEWYQTSNEAAWCIEVDASNLEIDNNYFHSEGCRMWLFARYHNFRINNDHHYHNNIIEVGLNPAGSHRYINNSGGVMNDILIENETINFLSSTGSKWEFWTIASSSFTGVNATPSNNVIIQDIALYGDNPGNANFYNIVSGSGGFTNSHLRNSRSTHLNILESRSGVTNANNQIISATDWFNLFGPRWDYTSSGYYYPKSGSPLIGVGQGGDSPGAVQP